jgi:hypothetical protein
MSSIVQEIIAYEFVRVLWLLTGFLAGIFLV